jgi:two-component system phosphate regulon response regulator PhoB
VNFNTALSTPPSSISPDRSRDPGGGSGRCVLLADDEIDVVNMLAPHLTNAGFRVLKCTNGLEALELAHQHLPCVMVLDIMMPEMSGLEVCKTLKADPRTADLAIIMLTARTSEVDRILSFELGADDYVTKPFSPRELVLRIGSILRRRMPEPVATNHLRLGKICLDRDRHEVTVRGQEVALTAIEFKMLLTLLENKGRTLSRSAFLNTVWGDDSEVEARTVDTHMRRLREKLGDAAEQVQTVRGFGYRLDER